MLQRVLLFFSPPLILLISILALRRADVPCSSTEARNTFFVLPQNRLTPFYFIPPPNWTRLNEGHKRCKWNITFSEMGQGFFFSFFFFLHVNWALRATCRCLRGCQGCLSHVARRYHLVFPSFWGSGNESDYSALLNPPQGYVAYRNTVVSRLSAFPHTWMSRWLFFDFQIDGTFCRAQRNKQEGKFSGAPPSCIPNDDSRIRVTASCRAQWCEITGEDKQMNGVNWCEGEDAEVRVSWRQTIGGRGGHGCGWTADRKRRSQMFCCNNFPVPPYYLNNCMNPYSLYPNWSFEKVAAETITFNPINAVQKVTVVGDRFPWDTWWWRVVFISSARQKQVNISSTWLFCLFALRSLVVVSMIFLWGEEHNWGKMLRAQKVMGLTVGKS